jgi:hypothetical protein
LKEETEKHSLCFCEIESSDLFPLISLESIFYTHIHRWTYGFDSVEGSWELLARSESVSAILFFAKKKCGTGQASTEQAELFLKFISQVLLGL